MKKVIRLTEDDLTRIVKRVIKEKEDDGKIRIPSQYGGVRMELGKEVSPEEIINSYNEIVDGTPLVSYSEYGTEGMFYNEDNDEIPLDVILDELNYAITGDDDMGGIVVPKSKGMGHKDGNDFYLDDHIKLTKEDGRIIFRFKPNKMAHSGARVISPKQIQELIDFLSE
jgi:hypothetical protein